MTGFFSVKNFEKFQHYKDRSPPWIRFYNATLDDYEYARLQDASKAHLTGIWLLASRYDNRIPHDPDWIARRINATTPVDLGELERAGFIIRDQGCSEVLADRKQDAKPEESRVEERQKEQQPPAGASREAYSEDFEKLWLTYKPIAAKNATKKDSFSAFARLSEVDKAACHAGLVAYVAWIRAERQKRSDTPAKHLASFINKRAWEPFEESAAPDAKVAWVSEDDPRWMEASMQVHAMTGKPLKAYRSNGQSTRGAYVAVDCVPPSAA